VKDGGLGPKTLKKYKIATSKSMFS